MLYIYCSINTVRRYQAAHLCYPKVQELYQLIEGQNTTLCKLREMAHRNQLAQCKVRGGGVVMI